MQPDRGTKRKILDLPEKKEKGSKRDRRGRQKEANDDLDSHQFKKILKKAEPLFNAQNRPSCKETRSIPTLAERGFSEAGKDNVLSFVENDSEVHKNFTNLFRYSKFSWLRTIDNLFGIDAFITDALFFYTNFFRKSPI